MIQYSPTATSLWGGDTIFTNDNISMRGDTIFTNDNISVWGWYNIHQRQHLYEDDTTSTNGNISMRGWYNIHQRQHIYEGWYNIHQWQHLCLRIIQHRPTATPQWGEIQHPTAISRLHLYLSVVCLTLSGLSVQYFCLHYTSALQYTVHHILNLLVCLSLVCLLFCLQ